MKNRNNNNPDFKTPFNRGAKVVSPIYNSKRTREKEFTMRSKAEKSKEVHDDKKAKEEESAAVKTNANSFLNALVSNEKFIPLLVGFAVVLTEAFIVSRNIKPIK